MNKTERVKSFLVLGYTLSTTQEYSICLSIFANLLLLIEWGKTLWRTGNVTHKKSRNAYCIEWNLVMICTVFTARCPPHFFQNILEEPKTKKWIIVWRKLSNLMVIFSKTSKMQGLRYKLCYLLLFIASCLGRFMPGALNKTERKNVRI